MEKGVSAAHDVNEDDFNAGKEAGIFTMVLGLSNACIGFGGLLFPTLVIQTGYLTFALTVIFIGFCSYYTANLIIQHLGEAPSMKESVLAHFNQDYRFMTGYSIIIWFSLIPLFVAGYSFVCSEVEGLVGYTSHWVPMGVMVILFVLIILVRILHFAEESLALGIAALALYMLFLGWAVSSAPSGARKVPVTGSPIISAGVLISFFQIHNFLPSNILKHHKKSQFGIIVHWIFIITTSFYLFTILGSFAIVNRVPFIKNSQVISDYFQPGTWPNTVLQLIYSVSITVGVPNFLLVSMIRFFEIFKVDLHAHLTLKEFTYILTICIISLLVQVLGVKIDTIFALNGAILGYLCIIVIPTVFHFKCVWSDKSSGFIQGDDDWNANILANKCKCTTVYKFKWYLYIETVFLCFLLILGLVLMISTILTTVNPSKN